MSYDLPSGLSRHELDERLGKNVALFYSYFANWESLGIMGHRGNISLDLVCDFIWLPYITDLEYIQNLY